MTPTTPTPGDDARVLGPKRYSAVLRGPEETDVPARVVEVGDGPTMLFLHGLVGLNEHWSDVVRRVRHSFHCVLLQVPLLELHGQDCSVNGVASMIAGFVERYVDGQAIIVGSSFGGHMALRLAIDRPELVEAIVLVGSSGLGERPMGASPKRSRDWMESTISELFYDRSKMRLEDVDRAHAELSDKTKARRMMKLSRSVFADNVASRLGDIRAPALVLWGREDIVTPPEAAMGFAREIPDAELVWIERCGHAPMIECPAEFAQGLLEFGEKLSRRRAAATSTS
ncbi:MAG: alpha/beta hydrolase [Phycisphaeraceae bacterium]|nr:alpha/beta hydrolase [Phycisphaeraceae bacterium]